MDIFGDTNPEKMPLHFFHDAYEVDYATATRANISAQDYSVCPRHWYIDARFRCAACSADFLWSAREQQMWFETYRFWVDSHPRLCRDCYAKRRNATELRQEYDALIGDARSGGTPEQKRRVIEIVDALESYFSRVPDKLSQTRELFQSQLAKRNSQ